MRSPGTVAAIPALGLAAALAAHEALLGIATLRLGAPSYAAHAHSSVGPALVIELTLVVLLAVIGIREALRDGPAVYSRPVAQPAVILGAFGISIVAVATLFGMEFSESGKAALGLGWIGAQALPGFLILAAAIASSIAGYGVIADGRIKAFERLIALFFTIVSVLVAAARPCLCGRVSRPKLALCRLLPCARHAGLRAPPISTM